MQPNGKAGLSGMYAWHAPALTPESYNQLTAGTGTHFIVFAVTLDE
jgi:hypothetical protein